MSISTWLLVLFVVVLLPVVCSAFFARWIQRQSQLKFEDKAKAWDVFIRITSALTALVGGALLIGKYLDEQATTARHRNSQEKRELDLREAELTRIELTRLQQKHDRMRKAYDEVKKLATHLADLSDSDSDVVLLRSGSERKQFEDAYWSDLIGVEGKRVEVAMVKLRNSFEKWSSSGKRPDDVTRLRLALSQSCEAEIEEIETTIKGLDAKIAKLGASKVAAAQ
jgi:hypothetical protein